MPRPRRCGLCTDVVWGLFARPGARPRRPGGRRGTRRRGAGVRHGLLLGVAGTRRCPARWPWTCHSEQLATARRMQRRIGPVFPLVDGDAERVPLASGRFDLVVSEHGAAAWCDPERWLPEAARLLRPGGRLVFLTNSHLSALCVPAEEGVAGERLLRGQREAYRVQWSGGGSSSIPRTGTGCGCCADLVSWSRRMHEIYAPPDGADHPFYEIVSHEWATRWPAEELWVACAVTRRQGRMRHERGDTVVRRAAPSGTAGRRTARPRRRPRSGRRPASRW